MADHAHGSDAGAHHGPSTKTYLIVAAILTIITAIEVWIYYIPAIRDNTAIFVPTLLALSAFKFFTVVGFYMHLKYDHRIFRALFGGPFLIAIGTIIALLFLFGKAALHM
ncbi:MAG TPA: cytochrome C oxidase subunit IV family protein [Gemmatimonadaceae bacterium]|nr:cytochrome C oxidase subunit IV family protein [Gemmatimonadaceae bacterium]